MADGTYKFGNTNLDLDTYVKNIQKNVDSYLKAKSREAGWTKGQQDEFRKAYKRYIDALEQRQLSADEFGKITDSSGNLDDVDQDRYYYNDRGDQINANAYNQLRRRKQKRYTEFEANPEVASYFKIIGKALADRTNRKTEYDQAQHGFAAWWRNYRYPGSTDANPFLDLDPVDPNTNKRKFDNRSKELAKVLSDDDGYIKWLGDQNLDYTHNSVDFDTRKRRLQHLVTTLQDNQWNSDDLLDAQSAGIDEDWFKVFFSDSGKPLETQADQEVSDAKAKEVIKAGEATAQTAEEVAKAKAAEEAKTRENEQLTQWFDNLYKKYEQSLGNSNSYTDIDSYGVMLPSYHGQDGYNSKLLSSFKRSNSTDSQYFIDDEVNVNKYVEDWLKNPFTEKAGRALSLMITSGQRAKTLEDGRVYIPRREDVQLGRALIYDRSSGQLYYTFIGQVPGVWQKMVQKQRMEINPTLRSQHYLSFREGGDLPKLQYGGYFDYNAYLEEQVRQERAARGAKEGRSEKRQQAAERIIGSAPEKGEENGLSPNNDWQAEDYARASAAIGDIISGVSAFVPGAGTAVSAVTGLGSTGIHFMADAMDSSVTWGQALQNLGINLGFDLAGLIPGGSAATKMGKITKTCGSIISKAAMLLGTGMAFANKDVILNSFSKFTEDPTKLTVADWQNIAQGLGVAFGITGAVGRKINQGPNKPKVNSQSVAIEMVNKTTGKKEYRVFTGDDAKHIREAQANGDGDALRKATIDKFDELKNMDIVTGFSGTKVRGFHDGKGWHLNPVARTEGKPNIFNIATGTDGKTFIQKGLWQDDVVMPNPKVKDPGKTNVEVAIEKMEAEDLAIAKDADVAAAIRESAQLDAIVAGRDAHVAKLNSKLKQREADLVAHDQTHARERKSSDIQSDIDRINNNQDSYMSRLSEFMRKSDMVSDNGVYAHRQQKLAAERSRLNTEIRSKRDAIKTKQDKLENAKGAKNRTRIQNEIDALNAEHSQLVAKRDRVFNLENRIGATRDQARTEIAADEQWLKDNDNTLLVGLNSRLAAAQANEATRAKLAARIDAMNARISRWKAYNQNTRAQASSRLEARKKPDGTIEFVIPEHTDPVVRKWDYIRSKFAITHRRGGSIQKFKKGDPINLYVDPDTKNMLAYSVPRNIIANLYNNKIANLSEDRERIMFLENPEENYHSIYGDFDAEQQGIRQKAELLRLARMPRTSDASLTGALQLEAAIKGNELETAGRTTSNKMYHINQELAEQERKTSMQSIHKAAEANRETQNLARKSINELEQMRLHRQYTNNDVLAQEAQYNAKIKQQTAEAYIKSDIHDYVMNNLKEYYPKISDSDMVIWNKVLSGTPPTSLPTAELQRYIAMFNQALQAEQQELRKYLGINGSRQSRPYTAPSAFDWRPKIYKEGGKLAVERSKNESKNTERFHKNVQKQLDRSEKALDRCSRYRYKRRT